MNPYRRRILSLLRPLLEPYAPLPRALDFGSGDGWFAQVLRDEGLATQIVAVDIQRRPRCDVEPLVYDGQRLPFPDLSFELVYSIDALHHCPDAWDRLKDLLRCARRYVVLKDHTYQSWAGWLTLALLDEVGNRRFGVSCCHQYQRGWQWRRCIEEEGFCLERLIHPAVCHTGPLGWATNSLQFVALWRREE